MRDTTAQMPRLPTFVLPLLMLAAGQPLPAATVYKCRQGERIVYQAAPCPPDAQSLAVIPPAAQPDIAASARARAEAEADIAAAAALRRREAQEQAQHRARAAAAERQALACARQLEVIRLMESAGEAQTGKRQTRRLALQERKAYIRECGPLPR